MKNFITRLYKSTICLTSLALLILIGCGNKIDEVETIPIEYRLKTIEIPDSINAFDVVITDDAVYYMDSVGVVRIDYDGKVEELFSLPKTESFTNLFIDEAGNFNVIAINSGDDGKPTSLFVRRYDPRGASLGRTNFSSFAESEAFRHAVNFLINDGHFYVQSISGIYVYDMSGSLVYEALGDGDTFSKSLFVLPDGRVGSASARFENDVSSFVARVYDIDEKDFDEFQVSVSGSAQDAIIKSGGATGLLLGDSTGLFEFNLEKPSRGKAEISRNQLLSFMERGVNAADIKDIHMTHEGDIIFILKRGMIFAGDILVFSEHGEAGRLTAEGGWLKEAGDPKVKEVVTLAMPDNGRHQDCLRLYIAEFNKTNPDYLIEIISYEDGSNSIWQLDEEAVRRFSIAIGTGQVADIIAFPNRGVPIYSYTSKGLFVDLYELMENDPDFNKADYLPNVFEALETDGKLYTIFPYFNIVAYIAKTSEVGGQPGWTLDEFIAYLDSKPEAEDIIMWVSREDFILFTSMNYFADRKTGRMTFDREIFIKILKAAERFSIEPNYNEYLDDGTGRWRLLGARDGEPLMLSWALFGGPGHGGPFRDIGSFQYYFGEEITYIGLPTPDGSGSFLM